MTISLRFLKDGTWHIKTLSGAHLSFTAQPPRAPMGGLSKKSPLYLSRWCNYLSAAVQRSSLHFPLKITIKRPRNEEKKEPSCGEQYVIQQIKVMINDWCRRHLKASHASLFLCPFNQAFLELSFSSSAGFELHYYYPSSGLILHASVLKTWKQEELLMVLSIYGNPPPSPLLVPMSM